MTYRRSVLSSVLTLTVAIGALHCGDDDGAVAPASNTGGKAGAGGKAGGAGAGAAGKGGGAGTGGTAAGSGGAAAGSGGAAAGSGGAAAGTGGAAAGTGGTTAGTGGTTAGTGGTGGTTAGTGGSTAGTGGSTAGTGGSTAGTGGTDQGGQGGTDQGGQGGTDAAGAAGSDSGGAGGESGAGGAVVAADFTIALDPSSVKLPRGAGSSVNVNVEKLGGFDEAVTVEVIGLPAGVTATNGALAVGETSASLSLTATAAATLGVIADVKVRATSGSIVREAPLAVEIVAPVATITSVELLAAGSDTVLPYKQFRQGYQSLRIKVSGADLGTPVLTDVKLGTIAAKSISNNSGFFIATFDVPHGEPAGLRDLSLTKAGGVAVAPGVAIISNIIARSGTGNDTTGRGTGESPFKTLTRANAVSGLNDTIVLGAGTYQAGETFPVALADGVTLRGSLAGALYGTTIKAPPAGKCLEVAKGGTIRAVALDGCAIGKSGGGKLDLIDFRSDDANVGVAVTGGEVAFTCSGTTTICEVRGATTGVSVSAGATVSGNLRVRNASTTGLALAGTAALDVALFATNGPNGIIDAPGGAIVLTGSGTLLAKSLAVTGIPRYGIRANATSSVTIDGATFTSTVALAGSRSMIELGGTSKLAIKTVNAGMTPAASNIDFLELDAGASASIDTGTVNGAAGQLVNGKAGATTVVTLTALAVNNFDTGAVSLASTFAGSVTLAAGTTFSSVGNATNAMMQDRRTAATAGITVAPGVSFSGLLVPAGTKNKASTKVQAGGINIWDITGNGTIVFQ